jgi:hypothetical protein
MIGSRINAQSRPTVKYRSPIDPIAADYRGAQRNYRPKKAVTPQARIQANEIR